MNLIRYAQERKQSGRAESMVQKLVHGRTRASSMIKMSRKRTTLKTSLRPLEKPRVLQLLVGCWIGSLDVFFGCHWAGLFVEQAASD